MLFVDLNGVSTVLFSHNDWWPAFWKLAAPPVKMRFLVQTVRAYLPRKRKKWQHFSQVIEGNPWSRWMGNIFQHLLSSIFLFYGGIYNFCSTTVESSLFHGTAQIINVVSRFLRLVLCDCFKSRYWSKKRIKCAWASWNSGWYNFRAIVSLDFCGFQVDHKRRFIVRIPICRFLLLVWTAMWETVYHLFLLVFCIAWWLLQARQSTGIRSMSAWLVMKSTNGDGEWW